MVSVRLAKRDANYTLAHVKHYLLRIDVFNTYLKANEYETTPTPATLKPSICQNAETQ